MLDAAVAAAALALAVRGARRSGGRPCRPQGAQPRRVRAHRLSGEVCYADLGIAPALASAHAVLAYAAYRGLLQLAHEAPGALPSDWSLYPGVVRDALVPRATAPARPRRRR